MAYIYKPSDWQRVPGTARNYRFVGSKGFGYNGRQIRRGSKVSRKQYDKIKGGPKQSEKVKKASRSATRRYNSLVRDRVAFLRENGVETNFNKVRASDEMKVLVKKLKIKKGEDISDPIVNQRRWNVLYETGRVKDKDALYILSL